MEVIGTSERSKGGGRDTHLLPKPSEGKLFTCYEMIQRTQTDPKGPSGLFTAVEEFCWGGSQ